jgi:hypothetical protein
MEQLTEDPSTADSVRLDEDWRLLEGLLPDGWMHMARELHAFRRARGIEDPRALLRVMLIHLAEGCGLRETAARASLAGIAEVSDVALLKRLRSCGPWFEWIARGLRGAPELCGAVLPAAQGVLAGRALRVVDGSVVSEPGATGSKWRLHYAIDLPSLHCQEVHLGSSDEGETLRRFQVHAGDVFMADRGYAHPAGIAYVTHHGGDVIIRMNLVTLPLQDPMTGERLDILRCVRRLKVGQAGSWPAQLPVRAKPGGQVVDTISGRLCAIRKGAASAKKSRQRVQRESQRNGTQVQPQTLEAAGYVLIFTTLSDDLAAADVMNVYRFRWQIEIEFKRLKSLIQLGHLKKHDPEAARSWLQGKLLVALLISRLIAHAERVSPWGYEISWFDAPASSLPLA